MALLPATAIQNLKRLVADPDTALQTLTLIARKAAKKGKGKKKIKGGVIAGIVIAIVVAIIVLVIILLLVRRSQRKKKAIAPGPSTV